MIRFDKFIYSLKIFFSGTFLYCCATLSTTWSVGRASTLPSSSGLKFPNSSVEVENHWEFKISRLVRFPKTIHSTPFLDLQPPDIHFTLDLWRTWGRWLKALQVITCTFSPRVVFLAAMWLLYLLSPLDLIPEAVFGIVGCHYSVRLLILVQVGLLDDLVIFILISMYLTFFFRCNPPLLCCNCISLNCRQIMAGMGDNPPAGINQWPFGQKHWWTRVLWSMSGERTRHQDHKWNKLWYFIKSDLDGFHETVHLQGYNFGSSKQIRYFIFKLCDMSLFSQYLINNVLLWPNRPF